VQSSSESKGLCEAGQIRENDAWEKAAKNSQISIVVTNNLIKSIQKPGTGGSHSATWEAETESIMV
jgi:hypothetical protein